MNIHYLAMQYVEFVHLGYLWRVVWGEICSFRWAKMPLVNGQVYTSQMDLSPRLGGIAENYM